MVASILKHAWALYRKHFGVIAAIVVVIWLPLELLRSYMDTFVFDPEDFSKSFRFGQFLENFVGIIATAGVISVAYASHLGQPISFGQAMGIGGSSWGRMWWTRFLTGLAFLLGLLFLVIPGIYLFVRLVLVETVAVCEGVSGTNAMRRSFELTKGRFWQVFLLGLACIILLTAGPACVIIATVYILDMDNWIINAIHLLFCDFVAAFVTVCFLCAYVELSANQDTDVPGLGENASVAGTGSSSVIPEGAPSEI